MYQATLTPARSATSGIGDADQLRRHGIDIVAHVPAVGRNLENHPGVDVQFATRHEDSLTSQIGLVGRGLFGARWLLTRKGLGASNLFEAGAFLRTRDDVAFPNMQYEFLPLTRQLRGGKLVPVPGFQFWMDLSCPESRGAVTLRSADPADPPSIVFNHLAEQADIRVVAEVADEPLLRSEGQPAHGRVHPSAPMTRSKVRRVPLVKVTSTPRDVSIMVAMLSPNRYSMLFRLCSYNAMLAPEISTVELFMASPPKKQYPTDTVYIVYHRNSF
ncbi:MAG: choline dehydrogenase [Micromonosporaceae bacterium]|nr:choline dehydrogenase [Micromonosporaceae bacterium]